MKRTLFILITLLMFSFLLAQEITPIADIQENIDDYDGQEVTIEGIITIGAGILRDDKLNAYIQDDSGRGIMLFDYSIESAYETDLVRGNKLSVTGEIENYQGTIELKDFSYEILDTEQNIPIIELTIIEAQEYEPYEQTFCQVEGTITDIYTFGDGSSNVTIKDIQNNEFVIRIWSTTNIDLTMFEEGVEITSRGIMGSYNSVGQIQPGYQDDIYEDLDISIDSESLSDGSSSFPLSNEEIKITVIPNSLLEKIELEFKKGNSLVFQDSLIIEDANDSLVLTIPSIEDLDQSHGVYTVYIKAYSSSNVFTLEQNIQILEAPSISDKNILEIFDKVYNPFRNELLAINYYAPENSKVIIRLYDSEGKLIYTPINDLTSNLTNNDNDNITYFWDGKDKNRQKVSLGLYICHIEVKNIATGKTKTATAPIVVADNL